MKQVAILVSGAACALVFGASLAGAQQVMWKDNPISGKVVGLTFGTSGWNAAEAQAVAYGGHLVTIRSASENQWLVDNFSSVWSSQGSGPWLGFSDAAVEGQWRWSSGEPTTYTNWSPGEPNNIGDQDYGRFASAVWDDVGESQLQLRTLLELAQRPPRSWSWPTAYATGARPIFGCTFDMDGDGDLDYASTDRDSGQVSIWRNNGSGEFTLASTVGGCGLVLTTVAVDWDADGDVDLLASDVSPSGRLLYLRNNGTSWVLHASLAAVPYCHGLAIGDVNADGRVDVVTTSEGTDDRTRVFLKQADGSLSAPTLYGPYFDEAYQPTLVDIDVDGVLDLIIAGGGVRLLRGAVSGTFVDCGNIGSGRSYRGTAADLNGDGIREVLISRIESDVVEVWGTTSSGPLAAANYSLNQSLPCGDGPHWVETGDVDGDVDLDVVVPSYLSDTVHILRNTPTGLVQDHVLTGQDHALYNAVVDLNGDAKPDILTSNHFANAFSVHFNQSIFDCNANGIDDPLDLSSGAATDCNSNGRPDSCDLAFGLSQDSDGDGLLNECEATLVSVTPNTLPAFVGGTVTVRGTNIPDGVVRLDLGGTPLPFTMTNGVGTVTIPPLTAASSADITVGGTLAFLGPNGPEVTGATPAVFTWDVPEITAATPGSAPYDQATGVVFTLVDSTLTTATGSATFGSAPAQVAYLFTSNGVSKVVTTAPPQAAPGAVSVLLQFGAELTLAPRGFVYLGPGITSLSRTQGWQAGGEALTLQLVDFLPGVPVDVRLGTGLVTGTPTGLLATSSLTITTPYTATAGAVDIELVQNAGQPNEKRALSPGAWLAEAPQVLAIAPASAYQGGGETISVTLAGLVAGAPTRVQWGSSTLGTVGADAVLSGTLDSASATFVTPVSPFAGACEFRVTQNAGTANELTASYAAGWTIVGPAISSLSPASGPREGGTLVTVQTSGFQDGSPAQVSLGGATVAGVVAGTGANQTVTFRTVLANASGPSDLTISQGVFVASLAAAYSFDAPRVVPYCVAKVTGQGTIPFVGFEGSPSVSTGDFRVTLSNALPNKTAQYFYGTAQSTIPLFGGTFCVGGSVVRGPLSSTNAGSFASVPFVVQASLVGAKRYFQWWFRDPLDPAGAGRGLSDGLEVEFYN